MSQKPNLLVADTNAHDLQLLEISLRNVGFSVTTATSGLDASKKIEIFPPDMIISETDLGDMDGFSFCETVKKQEKLKDVPFLFLSNDRDLQSKVRGLKLGVEDYLTKPIFLVELVARIRLLLQRKERLDIEMRESKTRFTGPLSEIGLVDILQTIDMSKKTGVVHMDHEGDAAALYFQDGAVIDAELGQVTGEEAVYKVLRWKDGFFDIDFRPIRRDKRVTLSTQELLLEGMRRLDEWNRILEQLPPMTTVFDVDVAELAERLDELPDEVNGLLKLIDGSVSLEEVLGSSEFPDVDTLRIVSKLIFFGILVETERKSTSKPPPPPATEQRVLIGMKKAASEQRLRAPERLMLEEMEAMKKAAPVAAAAHAPAEEKAGPPEKPAAPEPPRAVEPPREVEPPRAVETAKMIQTPREVEPARAEEPAEAAAPAKEAAEVKTPDRPSLEPGRIYLRKKEEKPEATREPEPSPAEDPRKTVKLQAMAQPLAALDEKLRKLKGDAPAEQAKVEAKTGEMYSGVKPAERREPAVSQVAPIKIEREPAAAPAHAPAEAAQKGMTVQGIPVPAAPAAETRKEEEAREDRGGTERGKIQVVPVKDVEAAVKKRLAEKASGKETPKAPAPAEKEPQKKGPGDSGVFDKTTDEFFKEKAPEAVDNFDDLEWAEKHKKESQRSKTGIYIIFVVIVLAIVGILLATVGRDWFKTGPDLEKLKLLETAEQAVVPEAMKLQPPLMPPVPEETAPATQPGEQAAAQDAGAAEAQEDPSGEAPAVEPDAPVEPVAPGVEPAPPPATGDYATMLAEGQALIASGKTRKDGIAKLVEAVAVNPAGQEAYAELIFLHKEAGKKDGVLTWGAKATELGPNDTRSWFAYGLALVTAGKEADSKAVFDHCVQITPVDKWTGKCKEMLKWVK